VQKFIYFSNLKGSQQLKGETNILYRLFTCKVRYFKTLFVIILMIMMKTPNVKGSKSPQL